MLYWLGVGVVAALLAYEHSLVRPGDLRRLDAAFFTMNGVISVAFFAVRARGRARVVTLSAQSGHGHVRVFSARLAVGRRPGTPVKDGKPVIQARGLGRRFGEKRVLDGVDLELARGGFLLVTGPNGSGKTTLLRLCAGLLVPTAGELRVDAPTRARSASSGTSRSSTAS